MSKALPPRATALLLALAACLLLLRLGTLPLIGPDEPRYARVAVEMHRAHEWVRPTLAGAAWLEKPPLYYWLAGGFFGLLGETETAARLPSVVAALLLVGSTALFTARLHGSGAGLVSGFVLATSLLPFLYGRAAAMDMLLAAGVTLALGFIALRFFGGAGGLAVPAAYVAMALATLAKGPLGVLLPGLVVFFYLLASREWSRLRPLLAPLPVGLFLLLALPWYLAVYLDQGPHFLEVFLLDHNLARLTSTVHHHPGPVFYYLPVVLLGLFPWTGLLLPALTSLEPRRVRADCYVLLWLLVPLLLFSFAGSKLPGYILPCLPPLALLMGRGAVQLAAGEGRLPAWAGCRGVAVASILAAGPVALAPFVLARLGEPEWIAALPLGVWAVLLALATFRRLARGDTPGALTVLRVGGAGLLLLLVGTAPRILARRESGRALFLTAHGREVLAWGAWRTAWMAGYFYNDGRVREAGLGEIEAAVARGPTLVLCGPPERRRLGELKQYESFALAEGPRGNTLLRVSTRTPQPGTGLAR